MARNWVVSWWIGCVAEVVMAGGCGDDDLVRITVEAAIDHFEAPARHFSDEVAALAGAATVDVIRGSAVGMASDVVDVADWGITERVPTGFCRRAV
jgi:hypothetical protein